MGRLLTVAVLLFGVLAAECAACGATKALELQHIAPRHVAPAKSLSPENVLTLCDGCHHWLGHDGDDTKWNPNIRGTAKYVRGLMQERGK